MNLWNFARSIIWKITDSTFLRARPTSVSQKALFESYRAGSITGLPPPDWRGLGFRTHSQNDEDGYLIYIFAVIGFQSRRVVEICCGDGRESNTANLILYHGCTGLLVDGDQSLASQAQNFYSSHPNTMYWPPKIVHCWVTAGNINELLIENGLSGDIDLLSIDIDGIDYWLWRAIDVINPRVVVTEINHLWGPIESVTVPYSDEFKAVFTRYGSDYAGASIAAFVKLAKSKGYRLVGANAIATNVFFVRNDIEHVWLPEVSAESIFWHPRTDFGRTVRFPGIKDMSWQRV
jgi:hypothetical protein